MATGMEPSEKSPAMAKFLEANFGRSSAINELKCIPAPVGCGRQMVPSEVECWDRLTIREYRISGLCKTCQDSVFGGDNEAEEPDEEYPTPRLDNLMRSPANPFWGEDYPTTFGTDDQ